MFFLGVLLTKLGQTGVFPAHGARDLSGAVPTLAPAVAAVVTNGAATTKDCSMSSGRAPGTTAMKATMSMRLSTVTLSAHTDTRVCSQVMGQHVANDVAELDTELLHEASGVVDGSPIKATQMLACDQLFEGYVRQRLLPRGFWKLMARPLLKNDFQTSRTCLALFVQQSSHQSPHHRQSFSRRDWIRTLGSL